MNMTSLANTLIKHRAPILASYLDTPLAYTISQLIAFHYNLGNELNSELIIDAINKAPEKIKVFEYNHREHLNDHFKYMLELESRKNGWKIAGAILLAILAGGCYLSSTMFHG